MGTTGVGAGVRHSKFKIAGESGCHVECFATSNFEFGTPDPFARPRITQVYLARTSRELSPQKGTGYEQSRVGQRVYVDVIPFGLSQYDYYAVSSPALPTLPSGQSLSHAVAHVRPVPAMPPGL